MVPHAVKWVSAHFVQCAWHIKFTSVVLRLNHVSLDGTGRSRSFSVTRCADSFHERVHSEPALPCIGQQETRCPKDDGQKDSYMRQEGNARDQRAVNAEQPAEDDYWLSWQQVRGRQRQAAGELIAAISRCSCPRCSLDCLQQRDGKKDQFRQQKWVEPELMQWVIPVADCLPSNNNNCHWWRQKQPSWTDSSSVTQGSRWLPPSAVHVIENVSHSNTTGFMPPMHCEVHAVNSISSTESTEDARSMATTSHRESLYTEASGAASHTVAAELHRLSATLAGNRQRRRGAGSRDCVRRAGASVRRRGDEAQQQQEQQQPQPQQQQEQQQPQLQQRKKLHLQQQQRQKLHLQQQQRLSQLDERLYQRVRLLIQRPPRAVMRLAEEVARSSEGDPRGAVMRCKERHPVMVSCLLEHAC